MAQTPESNEMPSVTVTKARRLSPVWIVPLLAALAVGYMIYDGIRHRGPMITITFDDAEGIVAGKSPLKFEGVRVGTVEDVQADVSTGLITLRARLDASARDLATEGSLFWIQEPEISVRGIASLDTLISGPYVACLPGGGDSEVSFDGLSERPPAPASRPGLRMTLRAEVVGALSVGSPVLYRGLDVGTVESIDIMDDGTHLAVGVFIEPEAAALVRQDTLFWEVTGLDVVVNLDHGLIMDTNSLRTLLTGAVAFHSSGPGMGDTAVTDETTFTLHRDPSTMPTRALVRIAGRPSSARATYEHLSSILRDVDGAEGVAAIGELSERVTRALDTLEQSRVVDSTANAMEQLQVASESASGTLERIDRLVQDNGDLARTIDSLHEMSSRLDETLVRLETDGTLAKADRLVTRLDETTPDLTQAMKDLSDTLERIDAIVRTNDRPLTETIQTLRGASLQLEALLEDLRTNPSQLLSKPPSRTPAERTMIGRVLTLLILFVVPAGCGLSHPYPSKALYVLPSSDLESRVDTSPMMLTIPRASVAAPFDSRALQYRVGESLFEPAYYQQWSADPGSLVSAAVSRSLASTGSFIVLAEGAVPGTPVLVLTVTELYADVRDATAPRAVLAMQATLVDKRGEVLMVRDARSDEPTSSDQSSDMIEGWAHGLGEITRSLVPHLIDAQ